MAAKKCALVIHGGAGTISPEQMTPQMERDLRAGLQQSLDAGHAVLTNGGSSLDAVVAAVRALEDDPLFNAGHGTVGAVALDRSGNLAAATSTGGNTNKWPGRIGDTPVIGAGTYANNQTCAVSATGDGEFFIRAVAGHDISALIQYGRMNLAAAARAVIGKVGALGGTGGLIAVDRDGNIALPFN